MSITKNIQKKITLSIKSIDSLFKWISISCSLGFIKVIKYKIVNKVSFKSSPWLMLYSSRNGLISRDYLDEHEFYVKIEPSLNKISYSQALEDKFFLGRTLGVKDVVENVAAFQSGCFYIGQDICTLAELRKLFENNSKLEDFVIKPSNENGGGKGVIVGNSQVILRSLDLFIKNNVDFIIQPKIIQHSILSEIYPDSVNTIRVLSVREDGEIKVLSSVLRVGVKKGVDNEGLSIGINDGKLNDFAIAIKENFKIYHQHPITEVKFCEKVIPNFDDIVSLVESKHKRLPCFDIISWDVAVLDNGNPIIIEFNSDNQELNFHQLNNGPVLGFLRDLKKNDQ